MLPMLLTGDSLTIADVVAVARGGAEVHIDPEAVQRVSAARSTVERLLAGGAPLYGINTGFGKLAAVSIDADQLGALQQNLIRSHAAGVGDPLPSDVVRALMLLRANVLLMPTSGVRAVVPERLVAMLNAGVLPVVPEQGSVGASGDLAPLAHVALALMGEGEVTVEPRGRSGRDARPVSAADALAQAGIEPLMFAPKEGLAFINGTQVQTAILALVVDEAQRLWRASVGAAAMSLEALMGTPVPFDRRFQRVRPHPGQERAARLLLELLEGSAIREAHRDNDPRVQDAYSLRCVPQVLGAVGDAIEFAADVVEVELNAATDNPLVFGDEILSGGNFHGQPVAQALDFLAIALTTLAGMAERRVDRLMNPETSHGLPAFLTRHPGLHSGLMMIQIAAASLVAESRVLATPASVQSIPTDGNQEDYVPMGMAAALKARRVLANARRVVACELLAGAQGLEFRKPMTPGKGVAALYARVRALVPAVDADRPPAPDIERIAQVLAQEALL